jgi:AcrR family transcriptional regulator
MGRHVAPETQRERILNVATVCFTELGYDRTPVDAIAARCGLSESVVRQHFADKVDIRTALFALWSERLSAWISSA